MINIRRIGQAIEYYEELGYEYIDTPWLVDHINITKTIPEGKTPLWVNNIDDKLNNIFLVGSAEQGFLKIYDTLKPNHAYISSSPCFRHEDKYDSLHQKYFYKVEMFVKEPNISLANVYSDALLFFQEYFERDMLKVVKTSSNSCDIMFYDPEDDTLGPI